VLKERKFDETAVEDLVVLKDRMALTNAEVAAALNERCLRIEKKFGNLMLSTDGAAPPHAPHARARARQARLRHLRHAAAACWPRPACSAAFARAVHRCAPE
jgi:hypothetical protein